MFLPLLLGTLAASVLGNVLIRKEVIGAGEGVLRAGQNFNVPHPLTNFEIQDINKTNLNLMVVIQEISYLK